MVTPRPPRAVSACAIPSVQGPFGGGLSSPALAAAVSNAGGLGSYGAQGLTPDAIRSVVAGIRQRTAQPFAVNLWVSTEDLGAAAVTAAEFATALGPLLPLYVSSAWNPQGRASVPSLASRQADALIDLRVPVISFVFGVPDHALVEACRGRGIVTMGAADGGRSARARSWWPRPGGRLGLEAGGHRPVVSAVG